MSHAAGGLDDATLVEHVDHVGNDVVEEPLVVGDDQEGVVGAAHPVDAGGDDAQGVHVEAGVGLVEDGQARFEHRHLENLVAFLFPAREADVDAASRKAAVHFHIGHLLAHQLEEGRGADRFEAPLLPLGVDGGFHEVGVAHAGNLHGILESQEDAGPGAFLGREGEQVAAVIGDGAFGHFKGFTAGQDGRQRALARAVGSHDGVDFAGPDAQVDAPENLFLTDAGVEVFYFEQGVHQAFLLYIFCQFTSETMPLTR